MVCLENICTWLKCNVLSRMKACEDRQRGDSSEVRGPNVRSGVAVHKAGLVHWYTKYRAGTQEYSGTLQYTEYSAGKLVHKSTGLEQCSALVHHQTRQGCKLLNTPEWGDTTKLSDENKNCELMHPLQFVL